MTAEPGPLIRHPALAAFLVLAFATAGPGAGGWLDQEAVLRTLAPGVVRADVAALILSGQEGGALPLAVAAWPLPGEAPAAEVPVAVSVEIDGAALLDGVAGDGLGVELFVYALGAGSAVAGETSERLVLDLAADRGLIEGGGLKVLAQLALPPGEHLLRVLVRRTGGEIGLRSHPVVVPDAATPVLLPPRVAEPPGRWLVALGGEGRDPSLPPVWTRMMPPETLPSSQPVAVAGSALEMDLALRPELAAGGLSAQLAERRGGAAAGAVPLAVEGPAPAPEGFSGLRGRLATDDVPPGVYELRLAADDGKTLAGPLTVRVVPAGAGDAWNQLAAPVASAADLDRLTAPAAGQAGPPPPAKEIVEAYERVVGSIDADPDAAHRALADLEQRLLGDNQGFDSLERAEWVVIKRHFDKRWPGALALAFFHAEHAQDQRLGSRFAFARHNRELAIRIVVTRAAELATDEARREAADLLAEVAGHLQQYGVIAMAEKVFGGALEQQADHLPSLIGMATIAEKKGTYAQAIHFLETVLEIQPEHPETRLRLAINLQRRKRSAAAAEILEQLAALGQPVWVLITAHQELARIRFEQGRLTEAATILRRALRRWPQHPGLQIQLAYVLDRQGDPTAARQRLEELDRSGDAFTASSRFEYNRWPRAELDANRHRLIQEVERWRPDFAAAIAGDAAK